MIESTNMFSISKNRIRYRNKYVIRDNDGNIIAQASYRNYDVKNFDWILISDVEVSPKYRNMGLATRLISTIQDDVRRIYPKKGLYLFGGDRQLCRN